ncbi:uncharacterized protein BDV14DRAFT_212169 [Aspergillus stella-maris]|uniref:uncharacterized protein n=1 Tax=Aspergillus stella-maris TaxID=1810926 RepID=UPI003CCCA997
MSTITTNGMLSISSHHQHNTVSRSFTSVSTSAGFDVVEDVWKTTVSQRWNASIIPDSEVVFSDKSLTVLERTLDLRGSSITPPSSPTASPTDDIRKTTILYAAASTDNDLASSSAPSENVHSEISKSAFHLNVHRRACEWQLHLTYDDAYLSLPEAEQLVDSFQRALETALRFTAANITPSPSINIPSDISVASSGGSGCVKIDRCVHDLIEERALARPEHEAIYAHDGSISCKEMLEKSSALAKQLIRLGAGAEQRVAIMMTKSLWYPVAALAVLKSGAAFVPLDPSHPQARLKQLAAEIEPCAIVTTSSLLSKAQSLKCPHVLEIDKVNLNSTCALPVNVATPNNAAYIIFTSGSTGKPKGVVIEHSALATSAVMRGVVLGLGPESRVLQYAPHTFDVSVDEILTTLIHGGTVCVPSDMDRFYIAGFMERARVTAALLTPTSARTLNPEDVPSLRMLQTGGEVLTEDVNDKWSNRVTLFNVYGPTEASIACVISNRTGLLGTGHVLGRAVGGTLWVVDPDDVSQRLSPNEVGELVISGPILARGYFRDRTRTEASFIQLPKTGERVYRTGDLASMDVDGIISYHGRKDLEVKVRGQRINIAEVEDAILQCNLVHSAVVEYPLSGPSAKRLTAIICLEEPTSPKAANSTVNLSSDASRLDQHTQALLHAHVSSILPPAMVPSKWLAIPFLPQMTSGKADRKHVRGWLEEMDEDTERRIFHGASGNTVHVHADNGLNAMWCKVLKMDLNGIRLDQSFIRNGGDSIAAMEARHMAHEAGFAIDIPDLLGDQSLDQINQKAASTARPTSSIVLEKDTDEPFPLSPVQQMYFNTMSDPNLSLQQRVQVDIAQSVGTHEVRFAIDHVFKKHRALTTRFIFHNGRWLQKQHLGEQVKPDSLYRFFTHAPESLQDFCTEPMDITHGPLLHAHLVKSSGDRQALILCAHHLVVDFVSWRVILHDLHDGLVAVQNATAPQPRTTSMLTFQQWCREEIKYASTLDPATVLPFALGPLDLDFWQPAGATSLVNTFSETAQYDFRLSAKQTAQLLDRFSSQASLHPTDPMISTFAMAFRRAFPERDTPNPSMNIAQTDALKGPDDAIRAASQRRQAVPNNGHPYWACRYLSDSGREAFGQDSRHQELEVVFNYAGAVVQRAAEHELFGEGVRISEVGHPNCPRLSLFDIAAEIEQPKNELVITYRFPKSIAHLCRIQELIQTHHELLTSVVEENVNLLNGTPPAQLSCPQDIAQQLETNSIDIGCDVEHIYAPSAIQERMLRRQALEPSCYRVRGTWVVEKSNTSSSIDMGRLAKAWSEVLSRHSTLRTIYRYSEDQQCFLAIVLHKVDPSVVLKRASDVNGDSVCHERRDLHPPHRMVLQEMSDGKVECQLEFSHAIIDAASRSIILQDLADAYEGKLEDRPLVSPPFWKYASLPHTEPTNSLFPAKQKQLSVVGCISSQEILLPCSSAVISEACTNNGVTIPSFFMAAWSVVLSQKLGTREVSFDYVQSDRFMDLSGIESAVGPYIRLPACEMAVEPGTSAVEMTRLIQTQRAGSPNSGYSLPSASTGQEQYSTLVNIRNSGTESLHMAFGEMRWRLTSTEDPWDYDIVFLVNLRHNQILGCSIDYAENAVSASVAAQFAQALHEKVGRMVQQMM